MPFGNSMRFGCGGWNSGNLAIGICCQVCCEVSCACAHSCTPPLKKQIKTNRTRAKTTSGFVSGYRFSDTVNVPKSVAPLGAGRVGFTVHLLAALRPLPEARQQTR